jgi:hypothetical protein
MPRRSSHSESRMFAAAAVASRATNSLSGTEISRSAR